MVQWLRAAMPRTALIVWAPLPATLDRYAPTKLQYTQAAPRYRQLGAQYTNCGEYLNPANKTLFKDGLHPAAAGYDALFRCMQPGIRDTVQQQRDKEVQPPPAVLRRPPPPKRSPPLLPPPPQVLRMPPPPRKA